MISDTDLGGIWGQGKRIPSPASIHGPALYESKDGSMWLGAFGGLTRIRNGQITVYKTDPLLSKQFVSVISEDEEGLIAGTAELRIVRVKDGKAQPFTVHRNTTPLSLSGNYTFTIYRQLSGTLWFGTVKGLFKYARVQSRYASPGSTFRSPPSQTTDMEICGWVDEFPGPFVFEFAMAR
jgi:hypothetical protein